MPSVHHDLASGEKRGVRGFGPRASFGIERGNEGRQSLERDGESGVEQYDGRELGISGEIVLAGAAPAASGIHHATSGIAACTCSMVTAFCLASAAAIRVWCASKFTLRGNPEVAWKRAS